MGGPLYTFFLRNMTSLTRCHSSCTTRADMKKVDNIGSATLQFSMSVQTFVAVSSSAAVQIADVVDAVGGDPSRTRAETAVSNQGRHALR